jgi:uncharacterized protein
MVAERRRFEDECPLADMSRLLGSLADSEGICRFSLEFGRDSLQVPLVELRIETDLPLICQRSLRRFLFPVRLVQRLGMIRQEVDEAALPAGYEPLLVPANGELSPKALVEDELVLALPVVPIAPDSEPVRQDWAPDEQERQAVSPFAVLTMLKKN